MSDPAIEKIFTKAEIAEINQGNRQPVPSVKFVDTVASYEASTLRGLRKAAMKPVIDHDLYDPFEDYDSEWVNLAIRNICSLWENPYQPLCSNQYEHWYTVNIFKEIFDRAFGNPKYGFDIRR